MSQENVERFLEVVKSWNRHDLPGVLRFLDPEIRFEHRLAAFQGSYVGVEGVRTFLADLANHFDTWKVDCRDVRDLGDRVLALGITRATGKGSGAETELPFTVVASFSGGRITRFIDFGDKEQALEAAGLSE
jgi:ketosteroid isomerase-like protein